MSNRNKSNALRVRRAGRNMKNGFTLVEMIVVMAILGILAGIAVPQVINYVKEYNNQQSVGETRVLVNGIKTLLALDYADGRTAVNPQIFAQSFSPSAAFGLANNEIAAGKIRGSSGLDILPASDCFMFNTVNPGGVGYAPFNLDNLIYYPDRDTAIGNKAVVYVRNRGYFVLEKTTAIPLQELTSIVQSSAQPDAPDT